MMVTFVFSDDSNGVLVKYKTDLVPLTKRLPDGSDELQFSDTFNVLDIEDNSWKFLKVETLQNRNEISYQSRALKMVVQVINDPLVANNQYYQLTSNPDSSTTTDTNWVVFATGTAFEASLDKRPTFGLLDYTEKQPDMSVLNQFEPKRIVNVSQFEKAAKDLNLNLDMYVNRVENGNYVVININTKS